ncbi:vWA domain-containing protein [Sulfitobacter sp. KE42]
MNAATPHPDAARKSENLALAQKNFADLQGSRDGVRLTSDRPKTGIISGVRNMLSTLTSRAGLTASTAIVAVGLVMLSPLGNDLLPPPTDTAFQTAPQPVEPSIAQRKTAPVEPAPQLEVAPMVATEMASDGTAAALPPASPALMSTRANGRMMLDAPVILPENITETFANADTNPIQVTAQNPVSTFSIDVDTASYSVIRNSLSNGQLPPKDAVRVEEMINYFPYDYAAPTGTNAFQPTVTLTPTPWNADTQLMQIAIQGALPDLAERPPLNLVFLIDTSGSMEQPNKLPLLKQSFRLMLGQLRPEDQVAIVTYAGSAGEVLAPTAASERTTILNALDNLGAGGSTAGQAGLQQAYATAAAMSEEGDVNRIILATDGDFNVGLNDPDALKDYIADKRDSGTYLSVLGFGRGNLDDATMQALAQNGNGQAAYIDTLSEAQKVLVDQLGGALFPIADDVKIQVEFNPATVSEYRLIGYETRALKREDFNNDKVDAGDIGAGHQVTAIYEVTPKGSPAERNAPLRYDTPVITQNASDELAFLRLRYKAPGSETSALIETPIQATITGEAGFAAAIAGFGHLLRDGTYTGDWTYADAIKLANDTKGDDPFGYRAEAVQLMRLAESLSAQ